MNTSKKNWDTPNLTVFGDLQELTQQVLAVKGTGNGDTFLIQIAPGVTIPGSSPNGSTIG